MKLLLFLLIHFVSSREISSLLDFCSSPPKTPPKTLSDKIKLPDAYKITGSLTDFAKSKTTLMVESSTKDYLVLQSHTRNELPYKWIQEKNGDHLNMFLNLTSGECIGNATKPQLITNEKFTNLLGNGTSFADVVNGLLEFNKLHAGYLIANDTEIVAGVKTLKWVSCVNGTNSNDTNVIVEVRYADDLTPAAQDPFGNPLLISVRLAEVSPTNDKPTLSHIEVELDRYELPSGTEALIDHGLYCTNRNGSRLNLKPMDEYAGILNYYDYSSNTSQVVEVLYSKSRQILVVSGHSMNNGVAFLKAAKDKYPNGTDYIVHDFKYGYEFTMRKDSCVGFDSIDGTTNDVFKSSNGSVFMKRLEDILIDPVLQFSPYERDRDYIGTPRKTLRAFDKRDETIIEVHLTDDNELISLATFHMGSRHAGFTLEVTPIHLKSSKLNHKFVQLSNCYDSGKFANNTWIMHVKNKNVTDIEAIGLNTLNEAVAKSIFANVYPVIPYRVLTFWVEDRDGGLSMVLRMSEKTDKIPANVGYNLTSELSTFEMFKRMNSSIYADKLPIEVHRNDGTKEAWTIDANTMKSYPPDDDNGFVGYTGGSMFVVAIFCLLIGTSIGAVGVFVSTRRQRISTLAYQVFE